MGSALFAAWFARRGHSTVAAGFALLALAESISLSGLFLLASAPTFPGAYTFAAGVALYAVALPLASAPPAFRFGLALPGRWRQSRLRRTRCCGCWAVHLLPRDHSRQSASCCSPSRSWAG